jgi:hypothetical protein
LAEISFDGGASGNKFTLRETTSGEVEIVNETTNTVLLEADTTSVKDAGGVQLSSHASRHAYGGADALADDALQYRQIKVVLATSETTVNVGAGSTQVISEGVYYVRCGANTTVEYSTDGGTTWVTLISAGGIGLVFSDGSNVRFNNAGAGAENSYTLAIQ